RRRAKQQGEGDSGHGLGHLLPLGCGPLGGGSPLGLIEVNASLRRALPSSTITRQKIDPGEGPFARMVPFFEAQACAGGSLVPGNSIAAAIWRALQFPPYNHRGARKSPGRL